MMGLCVVEASPCPRLSLAVPSPGAGWHDFLPASQSAHGTHMCGLQAMCFITNVCGSNSAPWTSFHLLPMGKQ